MDKKQFASNEISEKREKHEIIDEIKSIYTQLFDYEKNDLEDLTMGELREYLDDLSMKQPTIENIKMLLENSDIDFDGLEEMELEELLGLQERLEDNQDN